MMLSTIYELSFFLLLFAYSCADTPANCTYEEITGRWTLFVGEGGNDRTIDCSSFGTPLLYYYFYIDQLTVYKYDSRRQTLS